MRTRGLLLLLLLLLGSGAARVVLPAAPGPVPPAADRDLAESILGELMQIDAAQEHGSTAAAQIIRQQLLAAEFPPGDVVFLAPDDQPAKGNVVVRYRGKGRGPPVLYLGRLAVVEARRDGWSAERFDLVSQDAALMETLIRLRREHFRPRHDIVVAFTADEGSGADANGTAFLLKEHRELIDAGTAIILDGRGPALKNAERRFFPVATSQKVTVTYTLETSGSGGLGSLPGADNAIYRLAEGLTRLEHYRFPALTTATTRASFRQLADLTSGAEHDDLLAVAASPPDPDAADRLSRTDRWNAQLRTTCAATLICGAEVQNGLAQRARATVQCRLIPGDTAEGVQSLLGQTLNDSSIRISLEAPPIVIPESALTRPILERVGAVVHSMWPNAPIIPTLGTDASDARQIRSAGIPTYEMGGLWSDVDDGRAHGRDERVRVQAFDENVEFTYRLIKAFAAR